MIVVVPPIILDLKVQRIRSVIFRHCFRFFAKSWKTPHRVEKISIWWFCRLHACTRRNNIIKAQLVTVSYSQVRAGQGKKHTSCGSLKILDILQVFCSSSNVKSIMIWYLWSRKLVGSPSCHLACNNLNSLQRRTPSTEPMDCRWDTVIVLFKRHCKL